MLLGTCLGTCHGFTNPDYLDHPMAVSDMIQCPRTNRHIAWFRRRTKGIRSIKRLRTASSMVKQSPTSLSGCATVEMWAERFVSRAAGFSVVVSVKPVVVLPDHG